MALSGLCLDQSGYKRFIWEVGATPQKGAHSTAFDELVLVVPDFGFINWPIKACCLDNVMQEGRVCAHGCLMPHFGSLCGIVYFESHE